ncbi:MAG: putative Ig domain-containing protein, partial [Pirellula sp.]
TKSSGITVEKVLALPSAEEGTRKPLWASSASVIEGQTAEVWLMRLDASSELNVQYSTRGVSASEALQVKIGGDFIRNQGVLQFAVGEFAKSIQINTLYDWENEDTELVVVDFDATGFDLVRSAIRIGNGRRPSIQIVNASSNAITQEVAEGQNADLEFEVNSQDIGNRAFGDEFVFQISTESWSADTQDYVPVSASITLPVGGINRFSTRISTRSDLQPEDSESFFVNVTTPWGSLEKHGILIRDNSRKLPGIRIERIGDPDLTQQSDRWMAEEGKVIQFGISLDHPLDQPIAVYCTTISGGANEEDYSALNTSLVFERGETWKELSLLVTRDFKYELSENFFISVESPWHSISEVAIEIQDELLPAITVTDVVVTGGSNAIIGVQLSHALPYPVSIAYSTRQLGSVGEFGLMDFPSGEIQFVAGQTFRELSFATRPSPIPDNGYVEPYPAVVDFFVDVESAWWKATGRGIVSYPGGEPVGGSVSAVDAVFNFDLLNLYTDDPSYGFTGFFTGSVSHVGQPEARFAVVTAPSHGIFKLNAEGDFKFRPNPGFVGNDEFYFKAIYPTESTVRRVGLNVVNGSFATDDEMIATPGGRSTLIPSLILNDRVVGADRVSFGSYAIQPTPSIQRYGTTDFLRRPSLASPYHYFGALGSAHQGRYSVPSNYAGTWSEFYSDRHRLFDQLAGPNDEADYTTFLSELEFHTLMSGRATLDAPYIYGTAPTIEFDCQVTTVSGLGTFDAQLQLGLEDNAFLPPKAMNGEMSSGDPVWRRSADTYLGNVFEGSTEVYQAPGSAAWYDAAGRSLIAFPADEWEGIRLYSKPSVRPIMDQRSTVPGAGESLRGGSYRVQPDGGIIYTPPAGFVGTDWLAYVIRPDDGRMGIVGEDTCTDVGSLCSDELIGGLIQVEVREAARPTGDHRANLIGLSTLTSWSHEPGNLDSYVGADNGIYAWNDHNAYSTDLVIDGLHLLANDIGIHENVQAVVSSIPFVSTQSDQWGFQVRLPVGFVGDMDLTYILIDDGRQLGFPRTVTLSVHGPDYDHSPPVFTSTPVRSGFAGMDYEYIAHAVEPYGRAITYSLGDHPEGMAIDPISGRIAWEIPGDAEGGIFISVIATDTDGESAIQNYELVVAMHNDPPIFVTHPEVDVEVEQIYRYDFVAVDPDADALSFRLLDGNGWELIDTGEGTGTLTRHVHASDLSNPPSVTIEVSDSITQPVRQTVLLNVLPERDNRPPVITSLPNIRYVRPGSEDLSLGDVRDTATQSDRILLNLSAGQIANARVEIRLTRGAPKVDVMLLLDDTGSFESQNELLANGFSELINQLQQSSPSTDFGFGVSRFEDFRSTDPRTGASNNETGTPFTLNQPILETSYPRFQEVMQSAVSRSAVGSGGTDLVESLIEALYQLAGGGGIDIDNNGSTIDNGVAGSLSSQIAPSGQDVPRVQSSNSFEFDSTLHARYRMLRVSDQPRLELDQQYSGLLDSSMSATAFRYDGQENELLTLHSNLGWIDGARSVIDGEEVDAGNRIISVYAPDGHILRPDVNSGFTKQYRLPKNAQYVVVIDQDPLNASRRAPFHAAMEAANFNEAENSAYFVTPYLFTLTATSSSAIPDASLANPILIDSDATIDVGPMAIDGTRLYTLNLETATTPVLRVLEGSIGWELLSHNGALIRSGKLDETILTPTQRIPSSTGFGQVVARYSQPGDGPLPAGQYYLRIRSTSDQPAVRFRIMDPQRSADAVGIGQIVQRRFDADWSNYFAKFRGIAGDVIKFDLTAAQSTPRLLVLSPDGTVLVDSRTYQGNLNSISSRLPLDGIYLVGISVDNLVAGQTAEFSFRTTRTDHLVTPVWDTRPLTLGLPYESTISDLRSDNFAVRASSGDQFYFDGQQSDARVRVDYFKQDGTVAFSLLNSEMNRMLAVSEFAETQLLQFEPIDLIADVPANRIGGGGFRPGALPIIIATADSGSRYAVELDESGCVNTVVDGVAGVTGDLRTIVGNTFRAAEPDTCHAFDSDYIWVDGSTLVPPIASIATVQDAVSKLVEIGAVVVGLGTSTVADFDGNRLTPGSMLEELARLTGGVNSSPNPLPNNIPGDPIAPGDPFYISLLGSDAIESTGMAIQGLLSALAFDLDVVLRNASDLASVTSATRINVSPSQSGFADLQITGDGGSHLFYLEFLRHGTNVVLGRMPISINQYYGYDVEAYDPDGDTLVYSLVGETHGAAINSATGEISWLPEDESNYAFTVQVVDGRGGVAIQSWNVDVAALNQNNQPPTFIHIPDQRAEIGREYQLNIEASDPNNDSLRFQLVDSTTNPIPQGVSIQPNTGTLRWTPSTLQIGPHVITVLVSDGRGGEAIQTFTILVERATSFQNRRPEFSSVPIEIAITDSIYRYELRGRDLDGDRLQFRMLNGPNGMALDPATNVVAWAPKTSDVGVHPVSILLSDGQGGVVAQNFQLRVSKPNEPPTFQSQANEYAKIGELWSYTPKVSDPNGDPISLRLIESPAGMFLNGNIILWTPTLLGLASAVVEARDGRGGVASQRFTVEVVTELPAPNNPPVVTTRPTGPAYIGQLWTYDISAIDSENQPIQFQLKDPPSGMRILPGGPGHARITWVPASLSGNYWIDVWVSDDPQSKHGSSHAFTLPVSQVNQSPVVRSIPYDARVGSTWSYALDAADPDGDTLTYRLDIQQPGMTIDSSGVVRWTPTLADTVRFPPGRNGNPIVKIRVDDGHGGVTYDEIFAAVLPAVDDGQHAFIDNNPTGPIYINHLWTHQLVGIDPNGASNSIAYSFKHLLFQGQPIPDQGAITVSPTGLLTVNAALLTGLTLNDPNYEIVVKLTDEEQVVREYPVQARFRIKQDWPRITNKPSGELNAGQSWSFTPQISYSGTNSIAISLSNASVGSMSGNIVQFTPPADSAGQAYPLVIQVTETAANGNGTPVVVQQASTLVVTEHPPGHPRITSHPPTSIALAENAIYSYSVLSPDPGLSYRLSTGPEGMTVDSNGLVLWKPMKFGNFPVVLEVTNALQQTTQQRFSVSAIKPYLLNEPPEFSSTPTGPAARDADYLYQVRASDPNNDTIEYSVTGPSWLSIHASTGVLSGKPTTAGQYPIVVVAREVKSDDALELETSQEFVLTVLNNAPPQITSSIPSLVDRRFVIGSTTFNYQVLATDPNLEDNGKLRFSLVNPPLGASIDPVSGLLTYTTTNLGQRGKHSLTVQVIDASSAVDTQSFTVQALAATNAAPSFSSSVRASLPEGLLYSLELVATDLDGDDVAFALEPIDINGVLVPPPASMRLENGRVIVWTPPRLPAGQNEAIVYVGFKATSERDGLVTIQKNTVTITKNFRNSAPVILPVPAPYPAATVGYTYRYHAIVSDADNDAVEWKLDKAPQGMTVNPRTGQVSWAPTISDLGRHAVTLTASDPFGGSDSVSIEMIVRGINLAPVILSTPGAYAPIGQTYQYQVHATDPDQPESETSFSLIGGLAGMEINANGLMSWSVPQTLTHGTPYDFAIRAIDSRNAMVEQAVALTVYNPGINTPPTITTGLPRYWIVGDSTPRTIIASDSAVGQNMLSYSLSNAPSGMTFDDATHQVRWTPTESQIGFHTVSLVVFDGEFYVRDTQRIQVRTNAVPVVNDIPNQVLTKGQTLRIETRATDADQDALTFSVVMADGSSLPAGLSADPQDGVVAWDTAASGALGTYTLSVRASD